MRKEREAELTVQDFFASVGKFVIATRYLQPGGKTC